ncbi:MAG: methionine adenosyltransferase [Desulfobacterales bacterium]|jgi:S-adenosylmethionine synthetase
MFTSESVTEGHPDKLCDQISDAVVDHFLKQDPYARVRAECAVSSAIIFIAARFASSAKVDLAHLARKVIRKIGYDQPDFNDKICSILSAPQELQVDKTSRFDEDELTEKKIDKIAAKNQVTLFGFACDHTPMLMPLPIWLSNKLARQLTRVRRKKILPYIQPDGKVQVGVAFKDRKPKRIHSITISTSQKESSKVGPKKINREIVENVIEPVFKDEPIRPDKRTRIFVNPDGPYLGGPIHHSGLTGRKTAVDTYGEYARHSGDALSGKDPLRIDRVGAYAARYAAKNVVAAGLSSECEVMLSYSIGLTRPVSLQVQTFGTGRIPDSKIVDLLVQNFDFRLAGILRQFRLRQLPIKYTGGFFQKLAAYGHFGRTDMDLPWEATDKAQDLAAG